MSKTLSGRIFKGVAALTTAVRGFAGSDCCEFGGNASRCAQPRRRGLLRLCAEPVDPSGTDGRPARPAHRSGDWSRRAATVRPIRQAAAAFTADVGGSALKPRSAGAQAHGAPFCPRVEPVERTLENEGGGMLIDHRLALGAARVGLDQRALDRGRRQPLVPERDRQFGQLRKVAGEGARRLRARSFAAVHIDRQAEHETDGVAFGGKFENARGVEMKALPRNGLDRSRRRGDPGSLTATPMVLVPRSSPISAPRAGRSGAASVSARTGIRDVSHGLSLSWPFRPARLRLSCDCHAHSRHA